MNPSAVPRPGALTLTALRYSSVSACVAIRHEVRNEAATVWKGCVRCEIREVGWDGGQPESPLTLVQQDESVAPAGATGIFSGTVEIGTPFYTPRTPSLERSRNNPIPAVLA